jgi:hypothetical protein
MPRLSSRLPSPAMLVALLALFVALGGSAYAVKSASAPANSVVTKSIKKGAVTQLKIAPGAVGTAQIGAGAVGPGQIAGGAVGPGQIAPGAVGTGQVADGAITGTKIASRTITAGNIDLPSLGIPKATVYSERRATTEHTFKPEDQFQLLVSCLPGEMATGGGGRSSNGRISLSESIPFIDANGQRWGVLLHNGTTETLTAQVSAFVICASSQS